MGNGEAEESSAICYLHNLLPVKEVRKWLQ